jgi:hypothetical protein
MVCRKGRGELQIRKEKCKTVSSGDVIAYVEI